MKGEPYSDIK